ncbi:MAG TPA: Fic family protein [Anaerolineales bacterium]|nr:Fic family protein [Anaerolineales bacterium]HRQ93366.1 Fic family protein [Anaerolineales bacterium]
MKTSDFTAKTPGKVIKTLRGYRAFVPDPLPPNVAWSIRLLAELSKADRSLAKLAEVGNSFPVPQALMRPFVRKEAVLSSRIEGTRTSFEELLSYEAGQLRMFEDPHDAKEVHNYVKAMDYGLERLAALPISMRLIREIHRILMQGVRGEQLSPGEVRRTQNWIGPLGATLEAARFVPPPVEEMHDCLKDLERFIHEESELPPLVRIGLIHYQFETIHPFLDGNGRMGRLLVAFLLVNWNLLARPLLYLSNYFEANRQEYYDRLLAVSQRGEWEAWLTFFLEGVRSQADDASRRIARLQALRTTYSKRFANERSRVKLQQMVDYLISTPITSITQAQEATRLGSFTTMQRHIEKLEALGIVQEVTGQGRNRIYRAGEILRALEEKE